MQYSSRMTIAAHILMCTALFEKDYKVTSEFLAESVQVNPVVIRNILGLLKNAGLVHVMPGVGGCHLARPTREITLLNVFHAVEKDEDLFHFHENPNPACPVGKNIHPILHEHLKDAQNALEDSLSNVTLAEIMNELAERVSGS